VADFDPRHIVFPSDFAEEADLAVVGLCRLQALFPEAELHLLHVTACEGATEHAAARARIMAFAARHDLAHVRPAVMCTLSPSAGIPDYAHQVGADLVVVATHGRTGLSRFLQSSIAETAATRAFPPVLTFHFEQPLFSRADKAWSDSMAGTQII
jgi:nucleotide-binding universal stress UspA family protein